MVSARVHRLKCVIGLARLCLSYEAWTGSALEWMQKVDPAAAFSIMTRDDGDNGVLAEV
jgi:hypothetical protein